MGRSAFPSLQSPCSSNCIDTGERNSQSQRYHPVSRAKEATKMLYMTAGARISLGALAFALVAVTLAWAQAFPSFDPEGFCPGRAPPPIKQRTCSPFYFLASCATTEGATCSVAMDSILDNIRADNATWDCTSTNQVQLNFGGVQCGQGRAPPCTASVSLTSVDVNCKAKNFFDRWLMGTGWLPLESHFGQELPGCIVNATAWPPY